MAMSDPDRFVFSTAFDTYSPTMREAANIACYPAFRLWSDKPVQDHVLHIEVKHNPSESRLSPVFMPFPAELTMCCRDHGSVACLRGGSSRTSSASSVAYSLPLAQVKTIELISRTTARFLITKLPPDRASQFDDMLDPVTIARNMKLADDHTQWVCPIFFTSLDFRNRRGGDPHQAVQVCLALLSLLVSPAHHTPSLSVLPWRLPQDQKSRSYTSLLEATQVRNLERRLHRLESSLELDIDRSRGSRSAQGRSGLEDDEVPGQGGE